MSTRTNNSPYITSSDSKLQLSFTRFECKKLDEIQKDNMSVSFIF